MERHRATTAWKAIRPGLGLQESPVSPARHFVEQRRRGVLGIGRSTNLYEAIEAKADSSNTYIFEGFQRLQLTGSAPLIIMQP